MTVSCFYEGTVRHRRTDPKVEFRHTLELAYVDLDELPGLLGGRLVRSGPGPLRFRRGDYLGGARGSLDEAVRGLVQERTGRRPEGPIRLLTQLSSFGTCFNPVSFFYCFEEDGEQVQAIVAEVTNTPWRERHVYVIEAAGGAGPTGHRSVTRGSFVKEFHVSPFMGMDHEYTCRATAPDTTLSVHIESTRAGRVAFDATLSLRRRELDRSSLVRHVLRYPLGSLRVLALIYGQAVRLKLRGASYHPHPQAGTA